MEKREGLVNNIGEAIWFVDDVGQPKAMSRRSH